MLGKRHGPLPVLNNHIGDVVYGNADVVDGRAWNITEDEIIFLTFSDLFTPFATFKRNIEDLKCILHIMKVTFKVESQLYIKYYKY